MLLRGVISSRGGDSLHNGDLFFCFDNHLHYNVNKMLACFVNSQGDPISEKCTKCVYMSVDEEGLRSRKGCVRSTADFDQVEYLTIVSAADLGTILPASKRAHFKGSSHGNCIGDVLLPDISSLWHLTVAQKHALHGPYRIECGGKTKCEEGPGRGAKRKTPESREPVFWHSRSRVIFQEFLASYKLSAVVDFTPGQGTMAILCAENRIPYVGFALTDVHRKLLEARCAQVLLESVFQEGSALYDAKAAANLALDKKTTPTVTTITPKEPDAKSRKTEGASGSSGSSGANLLADFQKKIEALRQQKDKNSKEEQDSEE